MATTSPQLKGDVPKNGSPPASVHGALFATAIRHLVDQEISEAPELTYTQAQARVHHKLAEALGISRNAIYQMRYRAKVGQSVAVAARHWARLERLTGGVVKAEDFERAARNE